MSTLSLRLPASLHKQLRILAQQEGVSINQLAASALSEKMAALLTEQYLAQRAQRGQRSKFEQALGKVKAGEPEPQDRL